MDVRELILRKMEENGEVRSSEIVEETGYSRAYINRFFRDLREEGVLTLIGKANRARYIPAQEKLIAMERASIKSVRRILKNTGIEEDKVFSEIRRKTGIIKGLADNVSRILEYGFTKMLNNAIEHSGSERIKIEMHRKSLNVTFEVRDWGVGIYNHIREKKRLSSEMDAIQNLLKGKQTTDPDFHSGEGIFFTSKAADLLTIRGSVKKLVYDNLAEDIYIRDLSRSEGTRVHFSIALDSRRLLEEIFNRYKDDSYHFDRTEVRVDIYEEGTDYISRSQARRLVSGLEKFKKVTLNFSGVETIGQGFADEVFRVWHSRHPGVELIVENAKENVSFMIERARGGS
ncbi:MAG: DUF4325 domain-containing protein [Candidatus Latescibacteria bacterium]|nr:DUF4325 domain-containing protein [Candidatus Latescibacterota bacterium]